jgi:hypothetical protein
MLEDASFRTIECVGVLSVPTLGRVRFSQDFQAAASIGKQGFGDGPDPPADRLRHAKFLYGFHLLQPGLSFCRTVQNVWGASRVGSEAATVSSAGQHWIQCRAAAQANVAMSSWLRSV